MSSSRHIVVLFTLLLMPALLFGAITVTYTPASSIILQDYPGPYTSNTVIGAKLGTLDVEITGGSVIHSPAWGTAGEVAGGVSLTGPMYDKHTGGYESDTHTFTVMSVAYIGGVPTINRFDATYIPIYEQKCTLNSTFSVELWLVNTHKTQPDATVGSGQRPAIDFQAGSVYTLPDDFDPYFSFISANQGNTNVNKMVNSDGTPNSDGSYVSVSGATGPNSTPIINPSGYTNPDDPTSPGMTYGDPGQAIIGTSFTLESQEVSITLDQHTGTQIHKINAATLGVLVYNEQGGESVDVDITFTDNSPPGEDGFNLLHVDAPEFMIPYTLFWGNTTNPITKGVAIEWNDLGKGNHLKDIYMGWIDAEIVDQRPQGDYKSIVTVTIANGD